MDINELGFDAISLGHGSGGLMTRELLDGIIFRVFNNPLLGEKHDGSTINVQGNLAISTDSFVVSPIFFKGGNIGELAVNGTVNDVAMCGAMAKYLSLAFIVEEGLAIDEFVRIVLSIKETADRCDVQIITGDTKVVEKGKGDKIFINTTGFGLVHPEANIGASQIKTGDKILLNGQIARHGMAIMSQREGLRFESSIESDTTNLNFLVWELLDRYGDKIHMLRDPTRGGLASTLCEIATIINKGIALDENKIPLDRQVAAACEMLGLDSLFVANEGVLCVIVDPAVADEIICTLQANDKGKNAVCIGEVTEEHPSKVVIKSNIGGKRIVSPLIGEQLPRIC